MDGANNIRSRAFSLLSNPLDILPAGLYNSRSPGERELTQPPAENGLKRVSTSGSHRSLTLSPDGFTEVSSAHVPVRVVPVYGKHLDLIIAADSPSSPSLIQPPDAQVAQHNSSPFSKSSKSPLRKGPIDVVPRYDSEDGSHSEKQGLLSWPKREPARGHLYDHLKNAETPLPVHPFQSRAHTWQDYAEATTFPSVGAVGDEVLVSREWLETNMPTYERPFRDDEALAEEEAWRQKRRKEWWIHLQRALIHSPFVPLVLRTVVWAFCLAALILGVQVLQAPPITNIVDPQYHTSPLMAIVVDAVALAYLIYVTWDEYMGKPLGLRSARAKMQLIFLDLFFIIFSSANLSLAFESISGSSKFCSMDTTSICTRQRALASVILIALVAWTLTFAISVLRVVERVVPG